MQPQMIKIENNAKMEKAAARCRNIHPKVRRVDAQTVTVYGSKGDAYTVNFAEPKAGLKLAACNCEAGKQSQLCYHIAAALVAPVVKTGVAAPVADERATLISRIQSAWSKYTPHQIGAGLIRRFGVNQLAMLPDYAVQQIAAAIR